MKDTLRIWFGKTKSLQCLLSHGWERESMTGSRVSCGGDEAYQRHVVFIFTRHMKPEAKSLLKAILSSDQSMHEHTDTHTHEDRTKRGCVQHRWVKHLLTVRTSSQWCSDLAGQVVSGFPQMKYTQMPSAVRQIGTCWEDTLRQSSDLYTFLNCTYTMLTVHLLYHLPL